MAQCDECGRHENLPYQCRRCGGTFCAEHRLPENHDCAGLDGWNDPSGVFDSGFDDSVDNRGGRGRKALDRLTSTGGPLGYFRNNLTFVFLGLMWVTFGLQMTVTYLLELPELAATLFVLRPTHIEYVWTWFTSVFAHGGFVHIAFNSIALYFFGPLVERYLGSKRFGLLFLVSGAVAGLSQIGVSVFIGDPLAGVVGASGAIMAVLGVITVVRPNLRVMLIIPPIPMPIWAMTGLYALASVFGLITPYGGNIAHAAHLSGLVIGLVYGEHAKGQRSVPNKIRLGGSRGGRGPF